MVTRVCKDMCTNDSRSNIVSDKKDTHVIVINVMTVERVLVVYILCRGHHNIIMLCYRFRSVYLSYYVYRKRRS